MRLTNPPLLVPVLRAGLGMVDQALALLPQARVGFVGVSQVREHASKQVRHGVARSAGESEKARDNQCSRAGKAPLEMCHIEFRERREGDKSFVNARSTLLQPEVQRPCACRAQIVEGPMHGSRQWFRHLNEITLRQPSASRHAQRSR